MYFTKIRVNGLSSITLPIVGALPSDPYILKSADGLGPPEVDLAITQSLNAGGLYHGRRPQSREIVLLIGLNPNFSTGQTSSELRTTLYGMLTPGYSDQVVVEIMNGNTVLAKTTGYVKKLEIVPFDKEPRVQLTISCLEQYLQEPDLLHVDPGSIVRPIIFNRGTAPAGFGMSVVFTGPAPNWDLYDITLSHHMEINENFIVGDTLAIDTRPGSRGVWVYRDATWYNIIYALQSDSTWFMLHGGNNEFICQWPVFTWGDVFYTPQYWGI